MLRIRSDVADPIPNVTYSIQEMAVAQVGALENFVGLWESGFEKESRLEKFLAHGRVESIRDFRIRSIIEGVLLWVYELCSFFGGGVR